jgi:uncharacterized membrane protein
VRYSSTAAESRPGFTDRPDGYVQRRVRTMFVSYAVVIATGIVVYLIVGLGHY